MMRWQRIWGSLKTLGGEFAAAAANNLEVMTFADLFLLIEIIEQVVSGAQRLAAIKEKTPFRTMQMKCEGCFNFWKREEDQQELFPLIHGSIYMNWTECKCMQMILLLMLLDCRLGFLVFWLFNNPFTPKTSLCSCNILSLIRLSIDVKSRPFLHANY